ncbi:Phenol hydroxylase P5 protein [Piscirickettsia salmonis]|uniref:Ferredoxin n=1 Tax=Piscirickettsia salmonis TaxID=1238 RepID=A0A1L6T9Z0_PISSA|nr:2Fe-2S iron-sulfur cluster-binding protein [Piscirickettsia salmonis]AKP73186.1 2Fe-2S iron-sulfur cluster-binding protein [Piscirickettsia salmonis LF-89 = ATCC VR-1361]ALB21864.1 ferredoxin [Piscirickettsia salmonis]ALY02041.1 2Fe-2S iron-sulfur cluster-binding protein [Piscirickettsia salmonis]AMA41551.1 2Fe-2S iron-sulfur cluster-binding protein [Piscirickettsia salmonis]AOS34037.1 2Fe-2S iron-sulfur cluster-binding protein [Piscirickettsia salmonis]
MPNQVTIENSDSYFNVEEDERILDAALRQGIDLPFSCQAGVCGACRGQVSAGEIDYGAIEIFGLLPEEESAGFVLTCSAKITTDIILKMDGNSLYTPPQSYNGQFDTQEVIMTVLSQDSVGDEIYRLTLQNEASFLYQAGQYIDVIVNEEICCPLSIANAPHVHSGVIELHIRKTHTIPSWGNWVLEQAAKKKQLRIRGPKGQVVAKNVNVRPQLLIAGGTGFSQCKALLEQIFLHKAKDSEAAVYLYWGGRHREGLYLHQQVKDWLAEYQYFRYVPVLSQAVGHDRWGGRRGLIHQAVLDDFEVLHGFDVYAVGPMEMVKCAFWGCVAKGLPKAQFYSDFLEFMDFNEK